MSETLAKRAEMLACIYAATELRDDPRVSNTLRALAAENARLTRERYEAIQSRDAAKDLGQKHCDQRDAAHAALAAAEAERDRCREALRSVAGVAAVPWMDHAAQRLRIWKDARTALAAGKEETP